MQGDNADDSVSIVSINTIADDNSRENIELWTKIKFRLKRYFSSKLLNLKRYPFYLLTIALNLIYRNDMLDVHCTLIDYNVLKRD